VLTIFLFIFVLLGAFGFYVYNENQKRAEGAAALKVSSHTQSPTR
jgi:Na+/proline symporter